MKKILSMGICLLSLFMSGCKNELVPESDVNKFIAKDTENIDLNIKAPTFESSDEDVVLGATDGLYRSVILSWNPSTSLNVTQYLIYAADDPFSESVLVSETKGAVNSITLNEDPGTTKYYRIRTKCKINGQEYLSSFSQSLTGSTMAQPVISSIEKDADDTGKLTVKWWMKNCSAETYLDSVKYIVYCLKDDETIDKCTAKIETEKNASSVVFTGLDPRTKYNFQVAAFSEKDGSGKKEMSSVVDAETAAKLVPKAVEEFTASKGISQNEIKLTFTLPELVDYYNGTMSVERHPVYVTIERREEQDESASAWKTIVKYLGTANADGVSINNTEYLGAGSGESIKKDSSPEGKYLFIDCSAPGNGKTVSLKDGKYESKETDVVSVLSGGGEKSELYPRYTGGSVVTYKDSDVDTGKKYVYQVRSYVDDSKSAVSSDSASVQSSGWKIGSISFKVSAFYNKETLSPTIVRSVDVRPELEFDDYGMSDIYSFIFTHQRQSFYGAGDPEPEMDAEEVIGVFDSKALLNAFIKTYDTSTDANNGYYKYRLYIAEAGTTDIPSECYSRCEILGRTTITNDTSLFAEIEEFDVDDGYKDKFVVHWKYDVNAVYTLSWNEFKDGNPVLGDDENPKIYKMNLVCGSEPETIDNTDESEPSDIETGYFSLDGDKAVFEHKALSGDARKYSLIANVGLTTEKALDNKFETLGTPDIKQKDFGYDKILLSWKEVQMAENSVSGFVVNAYDAEEYEKAMAGEQKDISVLKDYASEKTTIEEISDITGNKTYNCTIYQPEGWDDAAVAGKDLKIVVTAKSTKTTDTSSATLTSNLIGPAKTNLTADVYPKITADAISVHWNKVNGAKGYLLERTSHYAFDKHGKACLVTDKDYVKNEQSDKILTIKYIVNTSEDNTTVSLVDIEGQPEKYVSVTEKDGVITFKDSGKNDREGSDTEAQYNNDQSMIPWGIPYTYKVLPILGNEIEENGTKKCELDQKIMVKDSEGNDVELTYTKEISQEEGDPVIETNLRTVVSATRGLGLVVDAAKAEHDRLQKLSWNLPYYGNELTPIVYRKNSISGSDWNLIENLSPEKGVRSAKYELSGDSAFAAFDYSVSYGLLPSKNAAYVDKLENTIEDDEKYIYADGDTVKEPKNKGYLLATKLMASYGGTKESEGFVKDENYFSEVVTIRPWNFEERKIGPKSYKIQIKNYDLTSEWIDVADLNYVSSNGDFELNAAGNDKLKDTTVENVTNGVRIKPTAISATVSGGKVSGEGTTDGILKILRHARHYYKLTLIANNSENTTVTYPHDSNGNDSMTVYAYRQITGEELIKSAMLNLAWMFNNSRIYIDSESKSGIDGGGESGNTITLSGTDNGGSGDWSWFKDHASSGQGAFKFKISNYVQGWTKDNKSIIPSGVLGCKSFIKMQDDSWDEKGVHHGNEEKTSKLRILCSNVKVSGIWGLFSRTGEVGNNLQMLVSPSESDLALLSYSGTISYSFNDNKFQTIYADNAGASVTFDKSGEDLKSWTPMRIGDVNTFFGGSDENAQNYGWWPKENCWLKDE